MVAHVVEMLWCLVVPHLLPQYPYLQHSTSPSRWLVCVPGGPRMRGAQLLVCVTYEATVREEGIQRRTQLRDLYLCFSTSNGAAFSEGPTDGLYSPVAEEAGQPQ